MERYFLICLHTAILIASSYYVLSESAQNDAPKNATPLMSYPWFHKKLLRQGISNDDANPSSDKPIPTPKRDCVCSKIYDPVCASNNQSYFNLCLLECKVAKHQNVTVLHQGNCIPF